MLSPPKFALYGADELLTIGSAFVDSIQNHAESLARASSTEVETEFVLDWFAATAPHWARVDARPKRSSGYRSWRKDLPQRQTDGEFLLDLTHTTYPVEEHGEGWDEYIKRSHVGDKLEVLLALESEFGKERSPQGSRGQVFDDASKLAVVRSRAKVMLFASNSRGGTENRDVMVRMLTALRTDHCDGSPWLWIDLPWLTAGYEAHFGVLS